MSQTLDIQLPDDLGRKPVSSNILRDVWNTPAILWCLAFIPHTVAILVSGLSIARGHGPGNLVDFLGAARDMLAGHDIYTGGTGGYVYPPLIAFLYQPLALMSDQHAGFVSLAINATLSIFTLVLVSNVLVHRLTDTIDPLLVARAALFGALCTADKIKGEFYHLETNVLMLLAFTAAMRWVDKRPWLCGLALGFAFNIKYLPMVLVPYLLLRRRFSAVGWFAVFAVAFALLPATSMGWTANLHAWAQASGGIFRLFGIHIQSTQVAHVRYITDPVSISLTSGLARITRLRAPFPLLLAAGLAGTFCMIAAVVYRRNRVPLIAWPTLKLQSQPPYRGLLSIEWMGMLLLTLIFSPFTNSRHLYMLLDVNIATGVLLFAPGNLARKTPLAIAAILMALGITLPPGGHGFFEGADTFWRFTSGGAWCMLGLYTMLIWTNVLYQTAVCSFQSLRTSNIEQ
jgi:hypothetical protein